MFVFRDPFEEQWVPGYGRVRKFTSRYSLEQGACERCHVCEKQSGVAATRARVTMVLDGSSDEQRYTEQMQQLMPQITPWLEHPAYAHLSLERSQMSPCECPECV